MAAWGSTATQWGDALIKLFGFLLALIAIHAPTPTFAVSDVTDISAQHRRMHAAPVRVQRAPAMRMHRTVAPRAVVRGPVRVNRAVAVRGPVRVNRAVVVRGSRGVPAARFGVARPGGFVRPARVIAGPTRIGAVPTVAIAGNRFATVYRTPRRFWWGGRWRMFVPLAALGAVAVGGAYFYPDAYVTVARPHCGGTTPGGCQLNWQLVSFEDGGDGGWQCGQYCPRRGPLHPARVVA